ncbi:UDP-N-acetylmuramoyl-tripeptide--D-alanyl-D-alanine ligase [Spongiactinospora rosea]|uniref:UDP-N-acetylmuramoyl-tripeptide--D-alanyl-D-alanine ligase n=1 Tax=Spongiactinospora rosea TaxID=2248750 RepID=A0A366LWY3_9ACTN|nr:UDP-N-acetylmuramoyl-tripeptide--D-alanyl-D-alanine ligase [Spongiactinospora rosea]RBQ17702.1 UDP-N-acetylmuramoyl-tripeptide--D-alanyl-D-alanine ligase [Spongiactinospora rosea]
MIPMPLNEIAWLLDAGLHDVSDSEAMVTAPSTVDSREVVPGGLFAATVGARVDGHDYAAGAIRDGAVAVLASRPVGVPALVVGNVQAALGVLARHTLERMEPTVVGITGSMGKTTTKDLLAQILERHAPTIATDRSFNNELGLPLTVLRADATTRYLVLEMGAGAKGDLRYLTNIAPPSVGVVLNVANFHMTTMGGTLEHVAEAKSELVQALPQDGHAVINIDDPYVARMIGRTKAHVLTFGRSETAQVRAEDVRLGAGARPTFELVTPTGRARITLDVIGEHQVSNALAAATAATALGLTIEEIAAGLNQAQRRSGGRLEIIERPDGVTIVNDAYNAGPESMRAALHALKALAGSRRTVAVLGAMGGMHPEASRERHVQLGRLVADLGIDVLIAVGPGDPVAMAGETEFANAGVSVHLAEDVPGSVKLAKELLEPGDVVLVKASNAFGLSVTARELAGA